MKCHIFSWKAARNSAGVCPSRICAPLNWPADCKLRLQFCLQPPRRIIIDLRAGRNGQRWFESLGASRVDVLPVADKPSADNPDFVARVASSHLIYLLGGFPRYLCETLRDSRVWLAALEAHRDGAVLAGSSAGAMVLCEYYYDPYEGKLLLGLNLLKNICVLPHHNRSGKNWGTKLRLLIPKVTLLGIDEQTGIINDASDGAWTVYGAGGIMLYRGEKIEVHACGEQFRL